MFTTRPEITGSFGVVSSTHWIASAVAFGVLERGGNAFDAAVAGGFTLHAVEPHLNGPAGDMSLLFYDARTRRPRALCGQGVAPAGATIEHYRAQGLSLVPATGLLATVVPGSFDAWLLLLRDHGSLRLSELLAPAIHYLRHGVPVLERIHSQIDAIADFMRRYWPDSAAIYLPGGSAPATGSLLRNPRLAQTWERLISEAEAAGSGREEQIEAARNCWAQGFVAEAIDHYCRHSEVMDSSGRPQQAVLRGDDMANWRACYDEPMFSDYGDYRLCKCGPWSQGPAALQTLNLLKGFDLAAMDPLGPDFVHSVVEAIKLAYADREAYYGDPDFISVPVATLLSDEYAEQRRRLITAAASLELRPGSIDGYEINIPQNQELDQDELAALNRLGAGEPTVAKTAADGIRISAGDTCHIDVIDRHGNMVAAMPSGGWLHSSPVIPGLGFPLNSRAQMFWLQPGLPASLAPGKRPRTTLTPSLLLREAEPYAVYGTPGGDQQDQWQMIFLLRHLNHGLNLQESIDLPSFHSEHFPSSFFPRSSTPGLLVAEDRFPAATLTELARRGHQVDSSGSWSEGRLCAASQWQGVLKAGANPRGMQGYAVGR
jgi:gamma-glutamyltranspeptidase/glutathione hydrolase